MSQESFRATIEASKPLGIVPALINDHINIIWGRGFLVEIGNLPPKDCKTSTSTNPRDPKEIIQLYRITNNRKPSFVQPCFG